MSCIMTGTRQLSALANATEKFINMGFNFTGYEIPDDLAKSLTDCRDRYGFYCNGLIYRRLYEMNRNAYENRYNREPFYSNDCPEMDHDAPDLMPRREYIDGRPAITAEHYKMLKLLQFYLYQCDEGDNHKTQLFQGLKQWELRLQSYIINAIPAYRAITWGSVD